MSAPNVFLLPDLGEGLTEAELVNWLVSVGDEIRVDQPIAEVETAKSMVEVPSPYAGTVAILHGEPGQTLDVGKPLISVTPAGTAGAPTVPLSDKNAALTADAAATAYREEEKAGSGNVLIGYGTPGGHGQARRNRPRKPLAAPISTSPASTGPTPGKPGAVSSPLVRRMARDHGVDLRSITGTGAAGLITRRDVEAALSAPCTRTGPDTAENPQAPATSMATANQTAGGTDVDARTGLRIAARTPVKGVRKAVAANMSRSRTEIPEATVWVDVDATALVELRASMKKRNPDNTPGLLAFIARFVTSGLKRYPQLNTRFQTAQDAGESEMKEIIGFDGINLGFAAQTDRGLVVPSIRNADTLSARELDAEIRRLSKVAREGKATPAELGSGTFTLNNYGVFGVDGSAAIINYPEAAILGVGRIIDRPWVVAGEIAVRKIVELTLVFDHRVCDGGTAGGFLRHVADAIENPASALADL
ncbi:dihydrolipoamide acetyltransferase family protein [Pseudarthrobacter raffinosi]|uniref:dihydrolipoamide acetyltransferase family protein n=1 Tax=Pseudarthrobacter raffinosi TaxID=2953651 RepID=UPI00208EB8D0|nr:dihydrolipoamide acetyltransferase family protein [Pseudarthrobacter sp. MDT3-9]MCO4252108.1 2-oxo acid dehydrogenase subunit E2 [Pseudarthrobacter sp. MDT3-9]